MILSVQITETPPSLFKEDGNRRPSKNKSDFLHILEKHVKNDIVNKLPNSSAPLICIIDVMAIQALDTKSMKFFEEVGRYFTSTLEKLLISYTEVHCIFDRYDEKLNPKDQERTDRYGKILASMILVPVDRFQSGIK